MNALTIVMTLMVRDEADIIAAMIEHHLAQGVDRIIVTDNGSIDGTREILADYESTGRVEVHDYLRHDKNQSAVVSGMASRAATEHGATWVVNADADEFFIAAEAGRTLREALADVPVALGSFSVPVINMTGLPAPDGAALERLVWRDLRDESTLMSSVALHAQPTPNVIHVGRAGVTVQQGNHGVDIPSTGQPDPRSMIETLHFPWRSYEQYSTKIENTGSAYDSNPSLNPSPRHHGMRDYRFWRAGHLEDLYLVRHPGASPGVDYVHDDRIVTGLRALVESGAAVHPTRLETVLEPAVARYSSERTARAAEVARIIIPLEIEHITASTRWRDLYRGEAARARRAEAERDRLAAHPEARLRRAAGRLLRGLRTRGGGTTT